MLELLITDAQEEPEILSIFKTAIVWVLLLLASVGTVQAAPTLASVMKAEETDGKPPVLVDGGLLGVLGSSIDDVQDQLGLSKHLLDIWRLRAERAADEAGALADKVAEQPDKNGVGDLDLSSRGQLGVRVAVGLFGLHNRRQGRGGLNSADTGQQQKNPHKVFK